MIRFGGENMELGSLPFLVELKDGPDNELQIVVAAEEIGETGYIPGWVDNIELKNLIAPIRQLVPSEDNLWLITFEGYIMYTVRDESYSQYGQEEKSEGRVLKIFDESILLDYVTKATFLQQLDDGEWVPGKWKHYAILTQNHTVDVIAVDNPKIRRIRTTREEKKK